MSVVLLGSSMDAGQCPAVLESGHPKSRSTGYTESVDRSPFTWLRLSSLAATCDSGPGGVRKLYALGIYEVLTGVVTHTPQPTAKDTVSSQLRTLRVNTLDKFPLVLTTVEIQCQFSGEVSSWVRKNPSP